MINYCFPNNIDTPCSKGFDVQHIRITLNVPIVKGAFEKALMYLLNRHPVLNTSFCNTDYNTDEGAAREVQAPTDPIPLATMDWSNLDETQYREQLNAFLEMDREKGFATGMAPIMRMAVIAGMNGSAELIWTLHRRILDDKSAQIVLKDLCIAYTDFLVGKSPSTATPSHSFEDYVRWLSNHDTRTSLNYFKELLTGVDRPTPLPFASTVSQATSVAADNATSFTLNKELAQALHTLATQLDIGIESILHCAWAILLGRYGNTKDVVFGTNRKCRDGILDGAPIDMVGPVANTLPLRVQIDSDKPVNALLKAVHQQNVTLTRHEHTPLSKVQSSCDLEQGKSLFETSVTIETQTIDDFLRNSGVDGCAECTAIVHRHAEFPLNLFAWVADDLKIEILYENNRFRAEQISQLLTSLKVILQSICDDPGQPAHSVSVISDSLKHKIVHEWNNTRRPFSHDILIHTAFEKRAKTHPNAIALEKDGDVLSYGALNTRANQLAHALKKKGAGPGTFIGVCLRRDFDLIAALLGIVKTGAAYLPLDPKFPRDRLAFMTKDANTLLTVTEQQYANLFDDATMILNGDERNRFENETTIFPEIHADSKQICYVIYTSGSTGKPKGVVLTHRAVVNTLEWVNRTFNVGPGDRLLFVTSHCFDLSVYDIFGTLAAGATIVIASELTLQSPEVLANKIETTGVTIWNSAPAALQRLETFFPKKASNTTLRLVLLSGDWIPVHLPDRIRAAYTNARVVSLGGATEAAVWSNWYSIQEVHPSWPSIPYGFPIQNARYHVLNEHMQLVPPGVAGELHIGGECLASGYLNRPELTAERFVADPFHPNETLYKTGDLARYFDDGCLQFLGRIDFQVKIRGFRVEIGEVESAITAIDGVKEAVCTTVSDISGQNSLVAHIVSESGSQLGARHIKSALAETLPDYMVPAKIVFLDAMPLSANGKVDRKALTKQDAQSARQNYVAPRNELEQEIALVWEELFQTSPIGITDNFFDLGGHSLIAVMLISRLREVLGQDIPLASIFGRQTISGLVGSIERGSLFEAPRSYLVTVNKSGSQPPLFLLTGAGGYGFIFHRLCTLLDADRPTYILNGVGTSDANSDTYHAIEEMAEIYENEIRSVYSGGPVIIGGYSFGALIAFELAGRLERRGEPVQHLISFDGFGPMYPELLPLYNRIVCHIRTFAKADRETRKSYIHERWQRLKSKSYRLLKKELPAEHGVDPRMAAHINRLTELYWKAQQDYQPDFKLRAPLFLFQSEQQQNWVGTNMEVPNYGWDTYVENEIDTVVTPGNHQNMLLDDNAQFVVQLLKEKKIL